MTAEHDRIPEAALDWSRGAKGAALATVVETWGSAPRPTRLAARDQRRGRDRGLGLRRLRRGRGGGRGAGGAGGRPAAGARLRGERRRGLRGRARLRRADPGDGRAGRRRRTGRRRTLLARLVAARAAREPVVYAVRPESWERRLVAGAGRSALAGGARRRWSPTARDSPGDWFLGVHNPPLRMAVVGAVHIAQALVPMARLAGYDVAVIDPREAFASAARFPGDRAVARLAGRGAGRVRARHPHGGGDADPRPEARRSGDRGGAAGAGLLPRLPRLVADPREAGGAAEGGGLRRRRRSRGSTRRSAPTSARSRRRRSRWRSSPRSPSGCAGPRRGASNDALRTGAAGRGRGRGAGAFAERRRAAAAERAGCCRRPTWRRLPPPGWPRSRWRGSSPGDVPEDAAAEAVARGAGAGAGGARARRGRRPSPGGSISSPRRPGCSGSTRPRWRR